MTAFYLVMAIFAFRDVTDLRKSKRDAAVYSVLTAAAAVLGYLYFTHKDTFTLLSLITNR